MGIVRQSADKRVAAKAAAAVVTALAVLALVFSSTRSADARTASVQPHANLSVAAFRGKDRFCDPWNFERDPDCRAAKYQLPVTPETGAGDDATIDDGGETEVVDGSDPSGDTFDPADPANDTGATDETGEPAEPMPGDWVWPRPPRGAYATLSPDGRTAIAPKIAPRRIKRMVRAANSLTRKPYVWGGGHARLIDRGYDCSGATSFVLRAGGFMRGSMVSGGFAKWGRNGPGRWIRIYAHKSHVFMVIAGLRFDTSPWGEGESGPRWRSTVRTTKGFALRHPRRY